MHDPKTVAFEIRRPWPSRSRWHDAKPDSPNAGARRRWAFRYYHDHIEGVCGDECIGMEGSKPWPWWKPSSYMAFSTIAGRGYYWPALITVWHNEPNHRDSGEVCPHYRRWQDEGGKWQIKTLSGWRWHAHHWSIQVRPFQHFRRWLLTRCEWCGGRSTKGDHVNFSLSWYGERSPWWRGERGLYHQDCTTARDLAKVCACEQPEPDDETRDRGYAWFVCRLCDGNRRCEFKTPARSDWWGDLQAEVVRTNGRPVKGSRYTYPKWATERAEARREREMAERRVVEAAERAAGGR